jgi:hypothetical protein
MGEYDPKPMDLNALTKHVWDLIAFIEGHYIEVRGDDTPEGDPGMIKRNDLKQETVYTLRWTVPWTETCLGCGETVERSDSHYGSQGNGAHAYQRMDGTKYDLAEGHDVPWRLFGKPGIPGTGW